MNAFKLNLLSLLTLTCVGLAAGEPKVGVMESAFGNGCVVESIALAKEAGYSGVQIKTGSLDENGVLTLANPKLIQSFKDAAAREQIQIVSLCAGSLNGVNCWDPESRKKAISIASQSIKACRELDVRILLVPFFGKADFRDDPKGNEYDAVVSMFRELLPLAVENNVVLGVESYAKKTVIERLLKDVNHPNLKVYYDTGNMQTVEEDIYAVIEEWGPDKICQIHLKPYNSPQVVWGKGDTDISKLASAIKASGYEGWFVFESGPGKKTLGVPHAKENREAIGALTGKL